MMTKSRGYLALAGMLLLGVALGLFAASTIHARRLRTIGDLVRPERFPIALADAIGPLPPEKEEAVRAGLDRMGRALNERILAQREETRAFADSLLEDLRPNLDERQWRALKARMGAMERRFDRDRPGPGRGPGFGPGAAPGPGPGRGLRGGRHPRRSAPWDSSGSPPPPPPPPAERAD